MRVVCIDNSGYNSLTLRKYYEVVEDAQATAWGQIRVIDDFGSDPGLAANARANLVATSNLNSPFTALDFDVQSRREFSRSSAKSPSEL